MKTLSLKRVSREEQGRVVGRARVELHPSTVVRRLRPGDVAVVDALDLDLATAEAIAARRPAAVLNASPSVSGRYPVRGAAVLVDAGVALVDGLGPEVLAEVDDGAKLEVVDGEVHSRGRVVARGTRQSPATVSASVTAARDGVTDRLDAFATALPAVLEVERDLVLDGVGLPEIDVSADGRPVVVVTQGYGYREDLARIARYVSERRPVVIGVDGGADAALLAGWRLDIALGDLDLVSDEALGAARAAVVHAPDATGGGDPERLARLGVSPLPVRSALTSEDTAILLAQGLGASRIVTVGSHATLEEFLDRGYAGMASSFVTRLRTGPTVVDACAVADLHRPRPRRRRAATMLVAALLGLVAAFTLTPTGSQVADGVLERVVSAIPSTPGAADTSTGGYRLTNGVVGAGPVTVRVLVQTAV